MKKSILCVFIFFLTCLFFSGCANKNLNSNESFHKSQLDSHFWSDENNWKPINNKEKIAKFN